MKKFIVYCFLLTTLFLHISPRSYSQIISGNSFLQGSYIRLGLAPNASFGTTIDAPAGMLPPGADIRNSPTCNLGKIGFVADVGKDGWAVGTPGFMGEYFLPGTPEEGWAVSLNGIDYNNNRNSFGITPPGDPCTGGTSIAGDFTSFQDLPDRQVTTWEGLVDGMKIIKKITLPKDKLYFITEIKLINTTAIPITDVYYMRNVDPDNEVVPVGSPGFTTLNKIEYQNPVSANKALVSARGQTYNSYLGLGTIDCRARVCIGGMDGNQLSNRVPRDVHLGAAPWVSTLGSQTIQDEAIAIAFKIGNMQPLDTARFAFAYILSQQDLEEALSKTAPVFNVNGSTVLSGGSSINCSGNPVPITIANGEDYSWTWSPATGLNTTIGPSVIYTPQPVPITYTITGTNAICTNATLTITMYPPSSQLAAFTDNAPCGSKTVDFTNQSLTLGDPTASYKWDFGDGSPINTTISPTHTFPNFGIYHVKLTIVTPILTCGTDTVIIKSIEVRDKPLPVINYGNNACEGSPVSFTGTSTITVGTVVSHEWILPGGITYNTPSITHTFPAAGTFDVRYIVTSNRGCTDTATKTITVESTPVADFNASNGCVNKSVTFTNNSTVSTGTIAQYAWDFGNGLTSTIASPATVYLIPGIKTIQLTASTTNGCSDTFTSTIDIESIPVAAFEYTNACPGFPINFTNLTSNAYGNITSYEWTFEPGRTSTLLNPIYSYNNDGNYPVTLKATTTYGCESPVVTHTIPIRTVKADAGKDTLVFKDSPFQLRAKGGLSYVWSPSIYLNANDIANPVGSIQFDQDFQVLVTDERGCKGSDIVSVKVFADDDIYVPTSFTPNNDGKNDLFRVIAPPGTVYHFEVFNRWGQKVFSTSNQQQGWNGKIQHILQPSGVYVWYLKAKTRQGRQVEKKGTVMLIW